jgi:hypothetical protein
VAQYLFLDTQLSLLEILNKGIVWQRSAHFLVQLAFDAGVLELKGAEMRSVHERSSFAEAASACRLDRIGCGGQDQITFCIDCEVPSERFHRAIDRARYCRAKAH